MFALLIISTLSSTVIQTQFDSGEVSESEQEYELSDSQKLTLADLNEKLSVSSRTNHTSSSPIWEWAVKAGGTGGGFQFEEIGWGIAVDSSGNAYVTGDFENTASFGSTSLTSSGRSDIFVAKLNSNGVWQWAVKAGGTSMDLGYGIAVDSSGNAYVTGEFQNTASFGWHSLTSSEGSDIFVAKLNSNGVWKWAVGADGTKGWGIAVDSSGNAYVTGWFSNTASFGSTSLTSSGDEDIFVAKLNSTGVWQWAVGADGSPWTESSTYDLVHAHGGATSNTQSATYTFTLSSTQRAVITNTNQDGHSSECGMVVDSISVECDFTGTGHNVTTSGSHDVYLTDSYGDGGNTATISIQDGGIEMERGYGIAVDSSGNAYVTGTFQNTASFGSTSLTSSGGDDIFVAKLNSNGAWQWAVKAGGTGVDDGQGIAVDSSGNAYVTGLLLNTSSFGSTSLTSSGNFDIFVAKLNSTGAWQWAVKAGGTSGDGGYGIAVDSSGNAYVTGWFRNTSSFGSTSLTSGGYGDSFVAKLNSNGAWQWAAKAGGTSGNGALGIAVDSSGNAYVTGGFQNTASFGSTSLISSGGHDIFVAQISGDTDRDGIPDMFDDCWNGTNGWTSSSNTDHDTDGCQDWNEDTDDDNDSVMDVNDDCPTGDLGWTSGSNTDHDTDGCQDSNEDVDDDNDSVMDVNDDCPTGDLGWTSGSNTDHDTDGCQDWNEDTDDDNDSVMDVNDDCPTGDLGWTSNSNTDYDSDGCQDSDEDTDDDNDGIDDSVDLCTPGYETGWISTLSEDWDGDGCRDSTEDSDDDNDDMYDWADDCPLGNTGWTSSSNTDHDTDGCQDSDEDTDDDNDSVMDVNDDCPTGDLGWTSNSNTDYDSDGCQDSNEDTDDDNDSVMDVNDDCPTGELGRTSSSNTDHDTDGCQDSDEDTDDDNDSVMDVNDDCPTGDLGWTSNSNTDYDSDGCQDSDEDTDDDNDSVMDVNDDCPTGELGWISQKTTDHDLDGCANHVDDDAIKILGKYMEKNIVYGAGFVLIFGLIGAIVVVVRGRPEQGTNLVGRVQPAAFEIKLSTGSERVGSWEYLPPDGKYLLTEPTQYVADGETWEEQPDESWIKLL